MFSEQFQHEAGEMLREQANKLVITQHSIAACYYDQRTGRLLSALSREPKVNGLDVSILYPFYARILDMKRTRTGKKKKGYQPIYNKYVYGYLYYGTYRRLSRGVSGLVVAQFRESLNGTP